MAAIRSILMLMFAAGLSGCAPEVSVKPPEKPITINLNIKLDAEVRVKLEQSADKDISANPDIF